MTQYKVLSLVIPCYNCERSIGELVEKARVVIEKDGRFDYEIILVNDGSKDGTWEALKGLAMENDKISALNLAQNFGQHNALMAGYRCVTGDIVVGLDDDGEHDAADMFKLIDELLEEDYDFVCASYKGEKKDSAFRNLGTKANSLMAEVLIGKPKNFIFSSYNVMRRFVVDQIILCTNPYPYIAGLILQVTSNLGMVELPKHQRKYGDSGYDLRKLLRLWLNGFTAFSVKPLRLATILGMATALLGFVYGVVIIINKLANPDVTLVGYSSIMASVLFIGGMVMILLGMIGEYVGRIYININSLPQYVVKEKVGGTLWEEKCGI